MQDILLRELNGVGVDYTTRVTESMLARVHFIVRTDPTRPARRRSTPTCWPRSWPTPPGCGTTTTRLVLERKLGDEQAKHLFARYADAFPEGYKDGHTPYEAMKDLAKLELLEEPGQLEMHLFRKQPRPGRARGTRSPDETMDVRFKVYRYGEPMMLSAVLPVLHSLGVRVVDEHPYEVDRIDGRVYLYDFGLTPARAGTASWPRYARTWRTRSPPPGGARPRWTGSTSWCCAAGLTWRQVVVLRAYAKYLRQAGTVFSQDYMEQTFIAYPKIAAPAGGAVRDPVRAAVS